MLYLKLFHGRKDPKQDMDDWGEQGPWIGPFQGMAWTYGDLRLFDENGDDFEFLSKVCPGDGDLVFYDGMYYGDFDVIIPQGLEQADATFKEAIPFKKFFNRS